jgi:hypothetical protein
MAQSFSFSTVKSKCTEPMKHIDKLVEIFVKCDDFYKDFGDFMDSKGLQNPIKKTLLNEV